MNLLKIDLSAAISQNTDLIASNLYSHFSSSGY